MKERAKLTKADFQWINWTPTYIRQIPQTVLAAIEKNHRVIKRVKNRTFENTIWALEAGTRKEEQQITYLDLLMHLSPQKAVREAAKAALDVFQQAYIDLQYDEEIYEAVKEYMQKKEKLPEDDTRLLTDIRDSYRRMGFDLPKEQRKRFQENSKKMALLAMTFEKNISDYEDHILVSKDDLEGLPTAYIHTLPKTSAGMYKVTLDYPSLVPFLQNAKRAKLRKALADKNSRKGGRENLTILQKLLTLRQENASLLGYDNHAAYVLEKRMAKRVATVDTFLNDLLKKLKQPAKRELRMLERKKGKPLQYYDTAYYGNQVLKEQYQIDSEALRPYFPLRHVQEYMFELFGNLFGITFREINVPVWDQHVRVYEVKEKRGQLLSYVAFDLFPRKGKFSHAMCVPINTGGVAGYRSKTYTTPFAVVVANFAKPTAAQDALLSHDEVETLFHEFGHTMHVLVTRAKHPAQAGTNVAWDFVETPSQLFENWIWEKEVLRKLSSHHKTKQPLDDDTIDRLCASRLHLMASATLRQCVLARYDLLVHTTASRKALHTRYRELYNQYVPITPSPHSLFPASLGHLASGYDAGYYSYLWALVYAHDAFSQFRKHGIFSKTVGKQLRIEVLARGSERDEMKSLTAFLGRKPNNRAFLRYIGVSTQK